LEFRKVEEKVVSIQESIRESAKAANRVSRTGQGEFQLHGSTLNMPLSFEAERKNQVESSMRVVAANLRSQGQMKYEDILPLALENRVVWERDVKGWLKEMHSQKKIQFIGLAPRERVPKVGHIIRWVENSP
jgi:hypothetical protein